MNLLLTFENAPFFCVYPVYITGPIFSLTDLSRELRIGLSFLSLF